MCPCYSCVLLSLDDPMVVVILTSGMTLILVTQNEKEINMQKQKEFDIYYNAMHRLQ